MIKCIRRIKGNVATHRPTGGGSKRAQSSQHSNSKQLFLPLSSRIQYIHRLLAMFLAAALSSLPLRRLTPQKLKCVRPWSRRSCARESSHDENFFDRNLTSLYHRQVKSGMRWMVLTLVRGKIFSFNTVIGVPTCHFMTGWPQHENSVVLVAPGSFKVRANRRPRSSSASELVPYLLPVQLL